MRKKSEIISVTLLSLFYLLCSIRLYPEQAEVSLYMTAQHLLIIAPFLVGAALIVHSIFRKLPGEKLPWLKLARIILTIGIIIELFLGISHYWQINS